MSAHQSHGRTAASIAELGALTRSLAERYETIFSTFRAEAQARADEAATLVDAALGVIELLSAVGLAYGEHFPNQRSIDCAAGCAACCHLAVATPPGVAAMIASYITAHFTDEERGALMARLRDAAAIVEAADDPARLRLRCPLLGPDERCGVYPVRPISCRAFTSPSRALCRRLVFEVTDETGISQHPALFRFHQDATTALQRTARNRGQPAAQEMLAPALIRALEA
ncbi:YkgJ family cysteine cluster protein [Caulobacter segnis]|uniref:YkgJ family cysteine cluster protein n=1 Tax=Caulobacter segnis TaxID=88688 RepID=UPI0024109943|nr:YkgJ family cysteine cluster protein [Caulobacter segnis]MDG2522580.1 YkgJ family cysteine cluster protein [Caulobacter segnis]